MTEEEALDFIKLLREGEEKVVNQLHKMPAHISFLTLLLSSEIHCNALLRLLQGASIPKDISVERMEDVISSTFTDQITFSDEELGPDGQAHTRALYVTLKRKGYVLTRVLIDGGSALDVCPRSSG